MIDSTNQYHITRGHFGYIHVVHKNIISPPLVALNHVSGQNDAPVNLELIKRAVSPLWLQLFDQNFRKITKLWFMIDIKSLRHMVEQRRHKNLNSWKLSLNVLNYFHGIINVFEVQTYVRVQIVDDLVGDYWLIPLVIMVEMAFFTDPDVW